jgi:hypothetical protein
MRMPTLSRILFAIGGLAMLFAQNPEGPTATNLGIATTAGQIPAVRVSDHEGVHIVVFYILLGFGGREG